MITLLWIIGSLLVSYLYLRIGGTLARRQLPHMWDKARATWYSDENRYNSVRAQFTFQVLLWPMFALSRHCAGITDLRLGDPDYMRQRIAMLEKEAGIR